MRDSEYPSTLPPPPTTSVHHDTPEPPPSVDPNNFPPPFDHFFREMKALKEEVHENTRAVRTSGERTESAIHRFDRNLSMLRNQFVSFRDHATTRLRDYEVRLMAQEQYGTEASDRLDEMAEEIVSMRATLDSLERRIRELADR